jgi:hypothetical protein
MKTKYLECKECDNAAFLVRIRRDCEGCRYKTNNQCTLRRGMGCCQHQCRNCGFLYLVPFVI